MPWKISLKHHLRWWLIQILHGHSPTTSINNKQTHVEYIMSMRHGSKHLAPNRQNEDYISTTYVSGKMPRCPFNSPCHQPSSSLCSIRIISPAKKGGHVLLEKPTNHLATTKDFFPSLPNSFPGLNFTRMVSFYAVKFKFHLSICSSFIC
jgi:hypothetical protein